MTDFTAMPQGLVFIGSIRGFRSETRPGAQFANHVIGVDIMRPDGWGGTKAETVEVRVSLSLYQQGVERLVESLKDKVCLVPVYVTTWTGKKGVGVNYNLSNHMPITELDSL